MVTIQEFGAETLTRVRRGWDRVVLRRRPATDGHRETARETGVMVGLMREARAAPEPTVDQQIFLSQSAVGMRARAAVLLSIPNRSLIEERELETINGWLAEEAARNAPPELVRVRPRSSALGLLGPLGASPMAGLLMSPVVWVAAAFAIPAAFGAVQTARLNHAKADLEEERAEVNRLERDLAGVQALNAELARAVTEADAQTRQTADIIEQERARRLRAEREARRIRDAMDQARAGGPVDYGFGGVRDDGTSAPGAGGGDSAGGRPR